MKMSVMTNIYPLCSKYSMFHVFYAEAPIAPNLKWLLLRHDFNISY